jgi:Rieske Fe-S protein
VQSHRARCWSTRTASRGPARQLKPGEAFLFNYPYTASPVFLLAFEREVKPAELAPRTSSVTRRPAGVGPNRSIVAFSAICAHKLVYPTSAISFIGLRSGGAASRRT